MRGAISPRATPRASGAEETELASALEEVRGGNREHLGAVPATLPAVPRPRVLVVDDSATVRRVVSFTLDRLGCEVVTAASGLEALGAMSHAALDLVLLDAGLPNLDGHQICRAIKRNERTRDVPVIMLTGRDGLMDRLRGKIAGAAGYLTKPFDPKALTAVVSRYISLSEPAAL